MTGIQRGAVLRTAGAYDGMMTGTVNVTNAAAQALAAQATAIIEVIVQNDPASANNIRVGSVLGQYIVLTAGQSITVPINNLASVYVIGAGAAASVVNWLAMT